MSEQAPGKGDLQIAAPTITRKRQNRISWIWLVPVVAALMGLSLVVRTWLRAGTDISITFNSADGLESARPAALQGRERRHGEVHRLQ